MAEGSPSPGGLPFKAEQPVFVDDITITGNGTPTSPLIAIGGSIAVVTDGRSISGDGTHAFPLATVPDETAVAVDGTTIVGSGLLGDPLIATGGAPGTTHVQPFSYTVTGLEPDLANITIPIAPSQPDGNYQLTVSQGAKTNFLATSIGAQVGASFVLELSNVATVGDVFEFILARAS